MYLLSMYTTPQNVRSTQRPLRLRIYNLLLTVRGIVTLQFVRLRASMMALACARSAGTAPLIQGNSAKANFRPTARS